MGRNLIVVNDHMVDLRTKGELIEVIKGMTADAAAKLKGGQDTNYETATLSFFGSINHYLEGGEE